MFQTVRHWWGGGRGKATAGLFLFEFVVIVVGVLVAQGLANWVQGRAALRDMELAKDRAAYEIGQSLDVAMVWQAAVPCLRERMESIQREAATGPIRAGQSTRPTMRTPPLGSMPDQAALLYRQRYGHDQADRFSDISDANELIVSQVATLQRVWYRLALADARYGPVSAADRQAARESAADALASLRTIGILTYSVIDNARASGIAPIAGFAGKGPARSCDAIWSTGRIDPPLTTP